MNALDLRVGDVVLVEAGDIISGDGDIIEGLASVNELAITGESAPVIREAGGLHNTISTLRQRIEDDPHIPKMVMNEEGFGYRLVKPPACIGRLQERNRTRP